MHICSTLLKFDITMYNMLLVIRKGIHVASIRNDVALILLAYEPQHEISNNVVCATSKGSDQPAHTRSLIRAFASRLTII